MNKSATPVAEREVNQIIDQINNLESNLLVRTPQGIEVAPPHVVGATLTKLSILLQQAVDPLTQMDLNFRKTRAKRLDEFLAGTKDRPAMKKSPAMDSLKFEIDLIEMESAVNRVNSYIKLTQQMISTFQTNSRLTMATNI